MTTPALGDRLRGQGRQDTGGQGDRTRRLLASGASAAFAAAGIGLAVLTILVLAGWIAAPHSGLGLIGVVRTAAVLWLVAHHVGVQVSGAGRIGMLPLGLVALPGALLWRAGRSVARGHAITEVRQVLAAAVVVAVPYSALACALALASRSRLAAASVPQAFFASLVIAFVAAGFGAARALAPWAQIGALMPSRTRSVLAGTATCLAVLVAAGAMASALALAGDVHKFAAVYRLLDPGVVGSALLLLAQLAYLPNAVLWSIAYMLGPGFAVGTGTVAAPTGSVLGPMPAFPLLAALPSGAHGSGPSWLGVAMLALPYLAGVAGGLIIVRLAPTPALESAPIRGFGCGLASGFVLGVGAAFSGGPLGNDRMAAVGPSPWQVAIVAALEIGIAAAVTAGAANWWYVRRRWPGPRDVSAAGVGVRGWADAGAGSGLDGEELAAGPPWSPGGRYAYSGLNPSPGDEGRDGGHTIYVNRWADDQDDPGNSAARPRPRRRGPSDLP
ncbi:MAG TPA: DUF6350 family protein [Streptosporangiaceae bacterium]